MPNPNESIVLRRPKRYRKPRRNALQKLTGNRARLAFQYRVMRECIADLFMGGILERPVASKTISGIDELYRLEVKAIDQREEYQSRVRAIRGYVEASEREQPFEPVSSLLEEYNER
jgi:hypothetical protein